MKHTDPLAALVQNYHDFNPAVVDELSTSPSSLDFLRYVQKNRPFVVRRGARIWPAVQKWDARYLRKAMERKEVKVAITPLGNADAVVEEENGSLLFVEPYEVDEDFRSFLDDILANTTVCDSSNVKYAQTQNDNLRSEYHHLSADVPPTISWATDALQQPPDAINFWLGNARSTTALHKDNYENIYVQIRGQKHFTLLPPVEMPCVNEHRIRRARYRPSTTNPERLIVVVDEAAEALPVPIWDPDEPSERTSAYSHLSKAVRVTLDEGDMLYLPAMWYHKVGQSSGMEGFACSVNYWYDMDFGGMFWCNNAFVRDVYEAQAKVVDYPSFMLGNGDDEGSLRDPGEAIGVSTT